MPEEGGLTISAPELVRVTQVFRFPPGPTTAIWETCWLGEALWLVRIRKLGLKPR